MTVAAGSRLEYPALPHHAVTADNHGIGVFVGQLACAIEIFATQRTGKGPSDPAEVFLFDSRRR